MPGATEPRRVLILGSTGSIGTQTLAVVRALNQLHAQGRHPLAYEVVGLAAGSNADTLFDQARRFNVPNVALARDNGAPPPGTARFFTGPDAAEQLVRETAADLVIGAMVGSAGLPAMLAALGRATDVALANKETLVAAGAIVTGAARQSGARLLPLDSEHSGLWQCLVARDAGTMRLPPFDTGSDLRRALITASGGPFLNRTAEQIAGASVEDALAHPTWDMGPKVTIDSASLTNKALELIEAHWLFNLASDRLGVLVHPQCMVHAIAEFADGSSIAQIARPDMATPIQIALAHPHRAPADSRAARWEELSGLTFRPPDLERFPALALGYRVIDAGGTAGAIFNAANERAVELFLDRRIPFGSIPELSAAALDSIGISDLRTIDDVFEADREARTFVDTALGVIGSPG